MTTAQSYPPDTLPALTITSIDILGRQGLGSADLADPQRCVALSAPWPEGVHAGDIVELFCNDDAIQTLELPYPETPTIDFLVQPACIPDEPSPTRLYYRITNRAWGLQMTSQVREVEVKRSVPGAPDPNPFTPSLNESLPPPTYLPEYIGNDASEQVLTIEPWENMAAGDVLTLYWGSRVHSISNPPLTEDDVGFNQTIVVGLDLLEEAGDNEHLAVTYDITDRAGNWSRHSVANYVEVQMIEQSLAAPKAADLDPEADLNLDSFASQDLKIRIPVYDRIKTGDVVSLYVMTDVDANAAVEEHTLGSQSVKNAGFPPEFTLPGATLEKSLNSSLDIYYKVQSQAADPRFSSRTSLQVTGSLPKLEAPSVEGADRGTLDPDQVSAAGLAVRIKPYKSKSFGDVIHLRWEGVRPPFTPVVYEDQYSVSEGEELLDTLLPPVPSAYLLALAGSTLQLSYSVELYDGLPVHSEPAFYSVISTENLPAPTVDHVQNDVLDPDGSVAGTYVQVDGALAALRRGDEVTIVWKGEVGSGSLSTTFKVISDNQNLKLHVDKLRVEANRNHSVEASYRVKRANNEAAQLSDPLTVLVRSTQQQLLPAAQIPQATDNTLGPLGAAREIAVKVSYPGMRSTDQISLEWNGSSTSATPVSQPGSSNGSVSFRIAASEITPLANRIVNVQYIVTRDGKTLTSDPLALKICDQLAGPEEPQTDEPTSTPTDLPDMVLNAYVIKIAPPWKHNGIDTNLNTGVRTGQGGKPPYTYTSSNAKVASVDSAGKVTGNANGEAIISIRDSANRTNRYRVKVSNVRRLVISEGPFSFAESEKWRSSIGAAPLAQWELNYIGGYYTPPWPLTPGKCYWAGELSKTQFLFINSQGYSFTIVDRDLKDPAYSGAVGLLST